LRKIEFVVFVKAKSKLVSLIPPRMCSPLQDHWNYFTWIFLVRVSIGGNKYGFVIVDDYSRYTWVFFMKDKSKVHEIFKKFATRSQNEFDVKIKSVRSDNGTEFKNTNIEEYLDEEGIGHELFVPYSPQQNGIVERKNRTLIEAARTMLDEYKTSDSFWAEAINTACHAINRLYLHKLRHKPLMSS
jgi:transposase InsO family protein